TQINELRTNTHYKESGIKEEYENMVAELSHQWSNKEQSLVFTHEEELMRVKDLHTAELDALKQEHTSVLAENSSSSQQEIAALKLSHEFAISTLEQELTRKMESLDQVYQN